MKTAPAPALESSTAPSDRTRLLASIALTAVTWWLAWSIPVAEWVLSSSSSGSADPVRREAANDAVTQGWWAIITVVFALSIGSLVAVALDYMNGRRWALTAWKNAVRLASTLAVMWAIWTVSVLAAGGVQPL
ncbi:hypothetical protein CH275_26850 [Rhodococcus sp. 06-235-1A]|uniref:hypothetical protein n=1 Tax=Rhodococcus sp. 06-235-1A TaxID=2022508 RepID=UPI000B9B76D5|nr:hypothetical protein [Rhodococcus sp. 06-235-1A]OZC96161.1 hypothetical protein CH275_26850 [Rhodococcus sp. 06-235-1A]